MDKRNMQRIRRYRDDDSWYFYGTVVCNLQQLQNTFPKAQLPLARSAAMTFLAGPALTLSLACPAFFLPATERALENTPRLGVSFFVCLFDRWCVEKRLVTLHFAQSLCRIVSVWPVRLFRNRLATSEWICLPRFEREVCVPGLRWSSDQGRSCNGAERDAVLRKFTYIPALPGRSGLAAKVFELVDI